MLLIKEQITLEKLFNVTLLKWSFSYLESFPTAEYAIDSSFESLNEKTIYKIQQTQKYIKAYIL